MSERHHIFISYARSDGREFAERIEADLKRSGYGTWRDVRNIDHYHDFSVEIETAIREASHVVVVITPSIAQRADSFVRREINYAQWVEKPIILLIFPDGVPPISVNHLTFIPFFSTEDKKQLRYEEGVNQLLERLSNQHHPEKSRESTDPFYVYVGQLLEDILKQLDQTKFVELKHTESANKVERSTPMALAPVADDTKQREPTLAQFDNLYSAFRHFKQRLLLLGEPGGGKTTTLLAFAREACVRRMEDDRSNPLPIMAAISRWDYVSKPSLRVWLSAVFPDMHNELQRVIANGNALLLLDGLDELGTEQVIIERSFGALGSDARRESHSERREEQAKNSPGADMPEVVEAKVTLVDPRALFLELLPENNQILLTCRTKDYQAIGKLARLHGAVTLQPLSPEQMQQYLSDLPDLWDVLEGDSELMKLASTPLILNLFARAFSEMGEMAHQLQNLRAGEQRDRIFRYFVENTYQRECKRHPERVPVTLEQLVDALQGLAFYNLTDDDATENVLRVKDLESLLDEDQHIAILTAAQALTLLHNAGDGTYRFVHLLLRDYFAYHAALKHVSSPDDKLRKRAVDALDKLRDDRAAEHLVAFSLSDADASMRARVARLLGDLRADAATSALIMALYDPEWTVRFEAAFALGQIASESAVSNLLGALDDEDKDVRAAAAYALGEIGSPESVTPLTALLESDQEIYYRVVRRLGDAYVCDAAARALGKSGDPARAVLEAALQSDSERARAAAAKGLGYLRDARSAAALIAALQDTTSDVRAAAAAALGSVRDMSAVQPLIDRLSDPEPNVRYETAWALGLLQDPSAILPLIALFADLDESDLDIASTAAESAALCGSEALPALLEAISSESPRVRSAAALALGELRDDQALPALVEHLKDADAGVREVVITALVAFGHSALMPVRPVLRDPEPENVIAAIRVLVKAATAEETIEAAAMTDLLPLSRHNSPDVRVELAAVLPAFGTNAFNLLAGMARDTDSRVRLVAIKGLATMDKVRAVLPLSAALRDSEPDVQIATVEALAALKNPQSAELLFPLLDSPQQPLAIAVVKALDRMAVLRDPRADAAVERILKGDTYELRHALATQLAKQNDLRALEPLIGMLRDYRVKSDNERGSLFDQAVDLGKASLPDGDAHFAFFAAVEQLISGEDYELSRQKLGEAIDAAPGIWYFYYWRAEILHGWLKKDFESALEDCTQALRLEAKVAYVYYERGKCAYEIKKYDEARADFDKAIQLQPDDGENYQWRGRTYYQQERYDEARANFDKAIQLQPDNGYNYQSRARTYYNQERYDEALPDFDKAIQLQPDNGNNYQWRGRTYYEQGRYDEARADYDKAVQLQPDNGNNYYWRGRTYSQQERYDEALPDFDKAILLQPEDGYNYEWRADTFEEQQRSQDALADYEKAIELMPTVSLEYYWRALIYLFIGDYALALADLDTEEKLRVGARDHLSDTYDSLWRGVGLLLQGYPDEAEMQMKHAFDLANTLSEVDPQNRVLAVLTLVQGQSQEARMYYRRVLDLKPKWHKSYSIRRYLNLLAHLFPERPEITTIRDEVIGELRALRDAANKPTQSSISEDT